MLIWGSKYVKRTLASGEFHCPNCRTTTQYRHVQAKRHGHLYWIPLIPLGEPAEYVECARCKKGWDPAILQNTPTNVDASPDPFAVAVLAAAISIAQVGGRVNEEKRAAIMAAFHALIGWRIGREAVDKHLTETLETNMAVALGTLQAIERELSTVEKETVIKALLMLAVVDGELRDEETAFIIGVGEAMKLAHPDTLRVMRDLAASLSAA